MWKDKVPEQERGYLPKILSSGLLQLWAYHSFTRPRHGPLFMGYCNPEKFCSLQLHVPLVRKITMRKFSILLEKTVSAKKTCFLCLPKIDV
jgi:hypothetical protein